MKNMLFLSVIGSLILLSRWTIVSADNFFITTHPTSDPAPSVFTYNGENRVYVYTTQDKIMTPEKSYPIDTIHCYSSDDMFCYMQQNRLLPVRSLYMRLLLYLIQQVLPRQPSGLRTERLSDRLPTGQIILGCVVLLPKERSSRAGIFSGMVYLTLVRSFSLWDKAAAALLSTCTLPKTQYRVSLPYCRHVEVSVSAKLCRIPFRSTVIPAQPTASSGHSHFPGHRLMPRDGTSVFPIMLQSATMMCTLLHQLTPSLLPKVSHHQYPRYIGVLFC